MISTEMAALEEISKMCGEVKSKDKDKTASTPLVTVTDLQKMKLFQAIIKRLRMNPFKTQYEPDFKINWGIERKELAFPKREPRPVATFDLKTFVSEAKQKKMMEQMGNNKENNFNPFTPSPSPFGNVPSNGNPFMFDHSPLNDPLMNKPMSSLTNDEIDKMIADIDKKLKELDEEEKKEKEKQQTKNTESSFELPKLDDPKLEDNKKVPKEQKTDKPKINVDADSIVMNDNVITDDEFFDDFFHEE